MSAASNSKRARDRRYYASAKGKVNRLRKRGTPLTSRTLDAVRAAPGAVPMDIARALYGESPNAGQRAAVSAALAKLRHADLIFCGARWIFTCPWMPEHAPVWPR